MQLDACSTLEMAVAFHQSLREQSGRHWYHESDIWVNVVFVEWCELVTVPLSVLFGVINTMIIGVQSEVLFQFVWL